MNKKNILITGASSGIGRALSIEYAATNIKLFLLARSQNKLQEVAALCLAKNAEVEIVVADVKDSLNMQAIIEKINLNNPIDIVIACAGISAGTLGKPEPLLQVQEIFNINLYGMLNSIMPVLPFMIKNKKGDIVILSSMAGLIGLASAPSYSASKAAVKVFGDALRADLKKFGINVCIVIPGYVDTPMTAVNDFPMPFKISAKKAAEIIIKAIDKKKGVLAFPCFTYILLKIMNLLPYQLIDFINSRLPGKKPLY